MGEVSLTGEVDVRAVPVTLAGGFVMELWLPLMYSGICFGGMTMEGGIVSSARVEQELEDEEDGGAGGEEGDTDEGGGMAEVCMFSLEEEAFKELSEGCVGGRNESWFHERLASSNALLD